MSRRLRFGVLIIAFLASGLFPAASRSTVVPFFRGEDLRGHPVNLGELIVKKWVVVFFWDAQRATSTREMKVFERLYRIYAPKGLEILGVEGQGVSRDEVTERLERLRAIGVQPEYPIIPDLEGRIARQFGVERTPQTFLVDRTGKVVFHLDDFRAEDEEILEKQIKAFIGLEPHLAITGTPPPPVVNRKETPQEIQPVPAPPENPRKALLERYRYFGNYYANRKELAKAEQFFSKYLEIAPEDIGVWLLLGEVHAQMGSYDRAREAWETVLRLQPRNAEADAKIRKLIRGEY